MITIRIFNTPVKIKFVVFPILLVLWGGLTWFELYRYPEHNFWQALLVELGSTVLLALADFGHPFGHIFSARYAGAPMDEILLSSDMPHTLYQNNEVEPKIHRMRALGGPMFNLVGLMLSLILFQLAAVHSTAREWMGWSAVGHAYILVASLLPLPMVDGGTILKWTFVARGKTEAEADNWVRRIDWILGLVVVIAGIGFVFMKIWIIGLIGMGAGVIILRIAAGKLR